MTDNGNNGKKDALKLSSPTTLSLTKTVESGKVKQNFQRGRSKTVTVEVKRTRTFARAGAGMVEVERGATDAAKQRLLNQAEREARLRALQQAERGEELAQEERAANFSRSMKEMSEEEEEALQHAAMEAAKEELAAAERAEAEAVAAAKRAAILAAEAAAEAAAKEEPAPEPTEAEKMAAKAAEAAAALVTPEALAVARPRMTLDELAARNLERLRNAPVINLPRPAGAKPATPAGGAAKTASEKAAPTFKRPAAVAGRTAAEEEAEQRQAKKLRAAGPEEDYKRGGKLTITQALGMDDNTMRMRSLSAVKRQRAKVSKKNGGTLSSQQEKIIRDVQVPEVITVQELANRMAERAVDVIRELLKLGTMATINQSIDADTAEIIVESFGHRVKRVSDADVEEHLVQDEDAPESLRPRAPVVTIMGHVDHGKTSLLDALRQTDVVSGEAGGITQHIGAYQVTMPTGDKITFLDTPGHEAFTAMRARGAKVTDIVVLVVAADDGIMPQTEEAINHAKAAGVPIIVAINKIDKPAADPARVKNALMNHGLVAEEFGGDVMVVEVSAKQKINLDKLEETILLQAEVLELRANPERRASGTVVEARMDRGRGVVATVLVQRGTLRIGDILVAGGAYGRVRAIVNDKGQNLEEAGPSLPVEILGLDVAPEAGDECASVENEKAARDIVEYRREKEKKRLSVAATKSLDQLFAIAGKTAAKELPIVIKSDVHGSAEAIIGSLQKFHDDEVKVRVLHSGVGAINESDITLASATGAMVIGFNVRAMPKAKELASQQKTEIRYYSIIYNLIDDIKAAISGLLSPELRENFIGYAEIRDVFNITKAGKVAGCMITDGVVKRGAKVRLLRDNIVIHEGTLKTLKRFKDEVKDVKAGFECGMAFENYEDIRAGDVIECFEVQSHARTVETKTE